MIATTLAATPLGYGAHPVYVEVDVCRGLPQMQIVGLPDTAVRESRDRVRAAIRNSGLELPSSRVTINLAPADLKKEGNHLDLAIAVALLVGHGHVGQEEATGRLFCGELGLDGSIRPIRGAIVLAELGRRGDVREVVVPDENAREAAALGGGSVRGAASLAQLVAHLRGVERIPVTPYSVAQVSSTPTVNGDLRDVRGQEGPKRAIEIAAAGGHNLLLVGPPGSGKTMLARRLPALLPTLGREEAIAVTKLHSLAGRSVTGLVTERPLRCPHTQASTAALVGGGTIPRPGEVSLAHGGVLFLDELPEFRRDALEALRQPLEDGEVTIVRARARFTYPARSMLVAAMNPCPCGHRGDPRNECRCGQSAIERYRSRVSGPLMDRIDLHVEVPVPTLAELKSGAGESSSAISDRVRRARERQASRTPSRAQPTNANLLPGELERFCALDSAGRRLLDRAYERLALSARALHRVLKVSRTIADLEESEMVRPAHLAEAIQYRTLDRAGSG